MCLSEKLEVLCRTKKGDSPFVCILLMDYLLIIYFVYDEICLNLFSLFMAGLWLYSIPYAVPQSGRLIWWRIALGWSGASPADSRTAMELWNLRHLVIT